MVELNTIGSAVEVYQELRKKNTELQYLATRVIPKERIKRITHIKRKLDVGESGFDYKLSHTRAIT